MVFERNEGQTDTSVKFLARGSGYSLFLREKEAVLALAQPAEPSKKEKDGSGRKPVAQPEKADLVRLKFARSNGPSGIAGTNLLPSKSNYFLGDDSKQWRTNVPNYDAAEYKGVYPGINAVFHGNRKNLEFDFNLAPGAGTDQMTGIAVDGSGDAYLVGTTSSTNLPGAGACPACSNGVAFVAKFDENQILKYASYLGPAGSDSSVTSGSAIAIDSSGTAYITGQSTSGNFPTTNGVTLPKLPAGSKGAAFVAELDSGGNLLASTYVGGSGLDQGNGVAADGSGNVYITGITSSPGLETSSVVQSATQGLQTPFVAELNNALSKFQYYTYLGGSNTDVASAIAGDAAGDAYIVGGTYASAAPAVTTYAPFQSSPTGSAEAGFTAELNSDASQLLYFSFLGGTIGTEIDALALDGSGNVFVTGVTNAKRIRFRRHRKLL